jgi:starch-binding outer membrane protein, SusD/RagB family
MNQFKSIIKILFIIIFFSGCKKFVEADPPLTKASKSTVFSNDISAVAAITSIYSNISINQTSFAGGRRSIGFLMGLYADELKNYSSIQENSQYYKNALQSSINNSYLFWNELYIQLHIANVVIDGVQSSDKLTAATKAQVMGEAKFMRALLHFYAVNLFGEVPLTVTTDFKINNILSRASIKDVYKQIVEDLKESQSLLSNNYLDPSGATTASRVRPNKAVATALLARVYLYTKEWLNAETEASKLIDNQMYELETDLNNVFLIPSKEAIWQLQAVTPGYNTFDGNIYILTTAPGSSRFPAALSDNLLNSFEQGDNRKLKWVGNYTGATGTFYYPYKYKIGPPNTNVPATEYNMIFRLAEQYLIRAEARIQQGNIAEGIDDLNTLRKRARMEASDDLPFPLPDLAADLDTPDALAAVMQEARVELFTEWGHRWFYLKNSGNIDSEMNAIALSKGAEWSAYKALLPIPIAEININHNLTQNDGYQ